MEEAHLDGAKDTHLREFLAIRPLMSQGSILLQDDVNTKPVRLSMRQLLKLGYTKKVDLEEIELIRVPGHAVLRVI